MIIKNQSKPASRSYDHSGPIRGQPPWQRLSVANEDILSQPQLSENFHNTEIIFLISTFTLSLNESLTTLDILSRDLICFLLIEVK